MAVQIEDPVAGSARESQFEAANFSTQQLLQLALTFVAPQLGAQLASTMGVSQVVGSAVASTALQVAAGVPVEDALKGAIASAVIQTGSPAVATEINNGLKTVVTDTFLRDSVSNAAGSAIASGLTAAARGGNMNDIINSAVAGAAGSGVASAADSRALGAAVAGGLTGGRTGAIMGAAGALAAPTPSTPQQKTASAETVQQALASADLTPDERAAVEQAIQDVYSSASTAQALPATATDAATGTSRIGSPFAANDPRFLAALQKNPGLAKAFSEYTNTYGFTTPVTVYKTLLEQELAKTPTDPTLLEEYKRVAGTDYTPAAAPVYQLETQYLTVPGYQPEITTAPGVTPEGAPAPATRPGVAPETAPGTAPAPAAAAAPGQAPAPSTGVAPLTEPALATAGAATPTGPGGTGTTRAPSPVVGPAGTAERVTETERITYPETYTPIADTLTEVSAAAPEITTDIGAEPETAPGEKKAPTEKKQGTYRPGLLTTSTVTRPTSPLARALQGDYYPASSTGLTAYRPAGEIESEETGKERQDVWNEASLRLKDALGL